MKIRREMDREERRFVLFVKFCAEAKRMIGWGSGKEGEERVRRYAELRIHGASWMEAIRKSKARD